MKFENWFRERNPEIQDRSIAAVLALKAEGGTIPFIARYRKEQTGNLDEVQIQAVIDGHEDWTNLIQRKEHVISEIEKQGKLTDELKTKIQNTFNATTLEDIYLPYKQKRKTKAAKAKEAGLEPLSDWLWNCGHGLEKPQEGQKLEIWALAFCNEKAGIKDAASAIEGAQDILVERISEIQELREMVRKNLFERGAMKTTKGDKAQPNSKFERYFTYEEAIGPLLEPQNSHRYLALRRGWMQEELKLSIGSKGEEDLDGEFLRAFENKAFNESLAPGFDGIPVLQKAARLALKAHVIPSIENEIHTALKKVADHAAIDVFAQNVRKLLMASPYGSKAVLGVDPGVRTGCKLAVVDGSGKFVVEGLIRLNAASEREDAKKRICEVAASGMITAIAVGNGTAGRETETFIRAALKEKDLKIPVVMVNEAGASVYSASEAARNEFPKLDITVRGAISIARRLQDPLAELVKIDPKSIGVGQYQHDVSQPALKKSLDIVVDSCVNNVGVNLNTASHHLLSHVSGIGEGLARAVVDYRERKGLFKSREELMEVARFTKKAYEQAAGFLKIPESENPLDNTGVHPERYGVVIEFAKKNNKEVKDVLGAGVKLLKESAEFKAAVGEFTFADIIKELEKPGRDPREAFSEFSYREDVHDLEDLQPGMMLPGLVTNVTNFGAFVDIGVHQDGLVHISQLSHKFVEDPQTVVKPGDKVKVKVLEVNVEKKQIALTMKLEEKPAQQARPEERASGGRPEQRSGSRPVPNSPGAKGGAPRPSGNFGGKPGTGGGDRRPSGPPKKEFKNNPFAGLSTLVKK